MLSLSLKRCHLGSSGCIYICCANCFWFGSHHGNFRFGSTSGGCMFQFMGPLLSFSLRFVSKVSKFLSDLQFTVMVYIWVLGFGVVLRV